MAAARRPPHRASNIVAGSEGRLWYLARCQVMPASERRRAQASRSLLVQPPGLPGQQVDPISRRGEALQVGDDLRFHQRLFQRQVAQVKGAGAPIHLRPGQPAALANSKLSSRASRSASCTGLLSSLQAVAERGQKIQNLACFRAGPRQSRTGCISIAIAGRSLRRRSLAPRSTAASAPSASILRHDRGRCSARRAASRVTYFHRCAFVPCPSGPIPGKRVLELDPAVAVEEGLGGAVPYRIATDRNAVAQRRSGPTPVPALLSFRRWARSSPVVHEVPRLAPSRR